MTMTWRAAEQATKVFEESGRMTASAAPGQPAKEVRRAMGGPKPTLVTPVAWLERRDGGGKEADGAGTAVGDDERAAVGRDGGHGGAVAGGRGGDDLARGKIDDADQVGAGGDDEGALAGGVDGDGLRVAREGDGGDDGVPDGVDDGERALRLVGLRVDDVDLVDAGGLAARVGGDGDGRAADREGAVGAQIHEVEHGDGVAGGIGDVGELAVSVRVGGEGAFVAGGERDEAGEAEKLEVGAKGH
jgi:hypothetical protein